MNNIRILTVEDEIDICDGLVNFFRRRGFSIDVATRGDVALNMLISTPYDCCLLDLSLPEMTGLEIIRRSIEANRPTTFFIVTGYFLTPDERKKYLLPQVKGFFHKPLDLTSIYQSINHHFGLMESAPFSKTYQKLDLSAHIEKPLPEMIHDLNNALHSLNLMAQKNRADQAEGFWSDLTKEELERLLIKSMDLTIKHLERADKEISLIRAVTRKR